MGAAGKKGLSHRYSFSTSSGRHPAPTHVGLRPLPSPETTICKLTFIKCSPCAEFGPLLGSNSSTSPAPSFRANPRDPPATKSGESGPSYGLRPAFPFSSYSCSPPIRVPAQSLRLAREKGLVPGAGPGSEAGGSHGRPGTRRGSPADPRLESEATPLAKPTLTACSGRYIH